MEPEKTDSPLASNSTEQKLTDLFITPSAEITEESLKKDKETDTYQFDDKDAVKLVLDDTETADNYINI